MAVKTIFSQTDFVNILTEYDIGAFKAAEPIAAGTVQTNYLLHTTQGRFVFRYYENRSSESVVFETNLIKYLNDRHFPCPAVLRNKHGKLMQVYRDKPIAIFAFVEGKQIEQPTEAQKKQLVAKVAELHTITKTYKPLHRKDRWNYGVDLCRRLARESAGKINTVNAAAKLAWYEATLQALELPAALPKGICHCDFHFSNVLYKDGEFNALIDFDDANYTYLIFDLATLTNPFVPAFEWNTWQNFKPSDDVFDFTEARNVVNTYTRYRRLNASEQRHLFDVFKLSIMLDCLWWFERGEVHDFYERRKIAYLDALGRDAFYRHLFG